MCTYRSRHPLKLKKGPNTNFLRPSPFLNLPIEHASCKTNVIAQISYIRKIFKVKIHWRIESGGQRGPAPPPPP